MAECVEQDWQSQPPPKKVYKYRRVDVFTESMINGREIFFSSSDRFNDPFDCRVEFSAESTPDEFQNALQRFPNASRHTQNHIDQLYQSRHQCLQNAIPRLEEHVRQTGVFCLSERPDSVLMWSHYAASHTGVCLEFDTSVGGEENVFGGECLRRVEYSQETPIHAPFRDDLSDLVQKSLFRKAIDWDYEKEWRIIRTRGADTVTTYLPGALTGIILGIRISDADKRRISRWCQGLHPIPKLSHAWIKEGSYEIGFKEVKTLR